MDGFSQPFAFSHQNPWLRIGLNISLYFQGLTLPHQNHYIEIKSQSSLNMLFRLTIF